MIVLRIPSLAKLTVSLDSFKLVRDSATYLLSWPGGLLVGAVRRPWQLSFLQRDVLDNQRMQRRLELRLHGLGAAAAAAAGGRPGSGGHVPERLAPVGERIVSALVDSHGRRGRIRADESR